MPISPQVQVQKPSPQQQQLGNPQSNDNGDGMTPAQCDSSAKIKPSFLRFGQLPGEVDHNERLTPVAQGSTNLSGTPGSTTLVAPNTTLGPLNADAAGGISAMQSSTSGTLDGKVATCYLRL